MPRQHVVVLSAEERARLRSLLRRDATTAMQQRRARILLAAETRAGYPVQTDVAVATAVGVDARTVARVRAEFARSGLERALAGQRPVFPPRRMLSSAQEAQLVTLACSTPPPGHAQWTLRLLAGRLVELEVIPQISHETVRTTPKKTRSSRGGCGGGESRRTTMPPLPPPWRMCWPSMPAPSMRRGRWSASTRPARN
jgi:hypothetical protein